MRQNIWKLYGIDALREMIFLIPVVIPFFAENGLSLQQAFTLQGIFAGAILILEIPTGYLADQWGRRNTLILSACAGLLGILTYGLSTRFAGFALAELLLAVCFSLESGTTDAILYESLVSLAEAKEYRRISGKMRFYSSLSQAAASILGGLVAVIALRFTVWLTVLPYSVGLVLALTLAEPPRQKNLNGSQWQQLWQITRKTLGRDSVIRDIAALYAVLAVLTHFLFWLTQPYQSAIGLPLWLFGIVHAVTTVGIGLGSKFAHRAEKWADDRWLLVLAGGVVIASYLGLGFVLSGWGLLFFFLGRATYGFFSTVTTDIVNRLTVSEVRATVLSIQSFGYRILFVAFSPVIGHLADSRGLNQSLLIFGVSGGLVLALLFLVMRKVWSRIPA